MSYENKGSVTPEAIVTSEPDRSGNYICNGTSDETEINQAINDLTSGRDTIEMVWLKGEFTIDDPILVPSYTHLKWTGKINLANDSDCNMIENANPASNDIMVILEGGSLNGNKGNQASGHGIYLRNATNPSDRIRTYWVRDVKIQSCKEDGLHADFTGSATSKLDIHGLAIRFPDGYAVQVVKVWDFMMNWCHPVDGNTGGFKSDQGGFHFMTNNYFPNGVVLDRPHLVEMTNFMVDGKADKHGIEMTGARKCIIGPGAIHSNGTDGNVNFDGINMSTGSGTHCTDNIFQGLFIGRTTPGDTNIFDRGIHEADANQDWNLFNMINGRDCVTAALRTLGANSEYGAEILGTVQVV